MSEEKNLTESLHQKITELAEHIKCLRPDEYVAMWNKPIKFLVYSFLAGIMRGLGIAVGMTVVVAALVYVLSKMINLPVIGYYVAQIIKIADSYLKSGIR